MDLKNKRILITQNSLRKINGSEVATLELATYLSSIGALVTVYTLFYEKPMKTFFEKAKINVISTIHQPITSKDFDIIWVHQQILPDGVIKDLAGELSSNRPIFIFLHMSSSLALERSYIHLLEEKISSMTLYISEESKLACINLFETPLASSRQDMYKNPAPIEYSRLPQRPKQLKSILIVSNHPPKEILAARNLIDYSIH